MKESKDQLASKLANISIKLDPESLYEIMEHIGTGR
jgi:hypothetical protein